MEYMYLNIFVHIYKYNFCLSDPINHLDDFSFQTTSFCHYMDINTLTHIHTHTRTDKGNPIKIMKLVLILKI